jgi:hypothetical protein
MEQNKQRAGLVAAITHGLKPLFSVSIASASLNHSNKLMIFSLYNKGGEALSRYYKQSKSRYDKESADRAEV